MGNVEESPPSMRVWGEDKGRSALFPKLYSIEKGKTTLPMSRRVGVVAKQSPCCADMRILKMGTCEDRAWYGLANHPLTITDKDKLRLAIALF